METHLGVLRDKGYKITPLRKAILMAFAERRVSLTADKLCQIVRTKIPNAGLQSVYRNLSDFTRIGLTETVRLERRKAEYALCDRTSEHHHHAICRRCHRAVEVRACGLGSSSSLLGRSFKVIKKETGFLVERHSLQFEGLCDGCRKK
jgi:Fur family transcriptional regulator, zinc uptake regulator